MSEYSEVHCSLHFSTIILLYQWHKMVLKWHHLLLLWQANCWSSQIERFYNMYIDTNIYRYVCDRPTSANNISLLVISDEKIQSACEMFSLLSVGIILLVWEYKCARRKTNQQQVASSNQRWAAAPSVSDIFLSANLYLKVWWNSVFLVVNKTQKDSNNELILLSSAFPLHAP